MCNELSITINTAVQKWEDTPVRNWVEPCAELGIPYGSELG